MTSKEMAKAFKNGNPNDKNIHESIMHTIDVQILAKYPSITKDGYLYTCSITGATFKEVIIPYGKKGKSKRMFELDDMAFNLAISHLTRYEKARELNLLLISGNPIQARMDF